MKNRLKPILVFFGLVLLIIIVSLIPELVGGDLADALKKKLGDNYYYIIGGIGLVTILAYSFWNEGDRIFSSKPKYSAPEKVSQDNLQKIRTSLLESYQQRIDNKLASRFPINIEVTYSREGSPTKGHLYNKSLKVSDLKKELIDIFDKQHGRLLIIGEPGAGKTTLLLQLAIKLLEREEKQIPLIIDIATWGSRFSSIEEWLTELLPQMGFSKALARQMIVENRLLSLFDGLDELAKKERPVCLNAIAEYGKNNQARYAICSRIREYSQTTDAAVYGQVMVKPLTLLQIEQGLKDTPTPEANGLLDAIKKDAALAVSLTTPFYLNTAQLLFSSKKTWEEFDFTSNIAKDKEQEIVEAFVRDSADKFTDHSQPQVKKWLGFLASRMNRENLVVIELTSLQYDWVRLKKRQILLMTLIFGLVLGLALGLVAGLLAGLVVGLVADPVFGLITGLILVLVLVLVIGPTYSLDMAEKGNKVKILTKGKFNWSFTSLKNNLKTDLLRAFIFALIIGLIFGLVVGLATGLAMILFPCVLGMLEKSQSYLKTTHPYQRFYASMWLLHFSILQHFHLRRILYKKDLLPWRLVDFLNEATKNNILESDGGSWRFRHRILQDYFAKHWEEVYAEAEDDAIKQ